MSVNPADKPINNPLDPALSPTNHYDEAAIKRARELLNDMPESVGPYRILERIGGGGMGEVYLAEQRSPIRRQVAIKFIKLGGHPSRPQARERTGQHSGRSAIREGD